MYIAKYLPTIRNSYVQSSQKKIDNKNWEHQWFPKLREISFKAEMSADGRTDWLTDWLTDSQSSLSSFYNIDFSLSDYITRYQENTDHWIWYSIRR